MPAPANHTRREAVFAYIIGYMTETAGRAPTVREIADACDLSSTSVVKHYLSILEASGLIEREENTSRGISVPGARWEYPAAEGNGGEYIDDWDILGAIRLGRGCGPKS